MTEPVTEMAASIGPHEPVYIGLGANLDDPRRQVESALRELQHLPDTQVVAVSPLYRTAPVGPAQQPDFINAVACLQTALKPLPLLAALQQIERQHGRIRSGQRWGPRTLDLDLLLYGARVLESSTLCVPHPQMHCRAFVLVPLADIAPARLELPGLGRLSELLDPMAAEARAIRAALECLVNLGDLRLLDSSPAGPLGRIAGRIACA